MHVFNMGVTVGAKQLLAMRRRALLQIPSGGAVYEDQVTSIHLSCTPYDKPRCWDAEFPTGEAQWPRQFVGRISWRTVPAERVELMLVLDASALRRTRRNWQFTRREVTQLREWMATKALALVNGVTI
jgi:hypothetical protein